MQDKNNFIDSKFSTIMNYVFNLSMSSLYFILCNFLLIFGMLFFSFSYKNSILLFILLLPMGPSITAMFFVMNKLIKHKDIDVTKDFFNSYKTNFKQSLLIWVFELIITSILLLDLYIFSLTQNILSSFGIAFVFVTILFTFLLTFYSFSILSMFKITIKNLLKISFISIFKHLQTTLCILSLTFLSSILLLRWPFEVMIFSSVIVYILMFTFKSVLLSIEENFIIDLEIKNKSVI